MMANKNFTKSLHSPRNLLILLVWVVLLAAGFWRLFLYANTPGASASASAQWPEKSHIARNTEKPILIVFAHPRCPCSRASVGELERMIPAVQGKLDIEVVFVKPKNLSEDWAKEALWKKAASLPGIHVRLDDGGVEAAVFDAKTSGQTFLFAKDGSLVFSGGITAERGHMGDNDGVDSILSYISQGKAKLAQTPVFGCSLQNPERAFAQEESHEHHH